MGLSSFLLTFFKMWSILLPYKQKEDKENKDVINEFSVKPKPTNNKARDAFIICTVGAFALITLSTVVPLYKGLVSLVGVALLSVALMLYSKYILPIYYYDITFDSDGTPVFVVRQQTGKRYTTLCRIALHEIVKIEKESRAERREHKTPFDTKKYSYLPTLDPSEVYRITTSGRYERAEILIESSEGFAELLRSYAIEARDFLADDQY